MIKTGFRVIVFIPFISLIVACHHQEEINVDEMKKQIEKADLDMSSMANKEGFHKAILYYADSSMVKFSDGGYPVIGKKDYAETIGKHKDVKTIVWKPVYVDVAKSGELGYSWGNWKDVEKDSSYYGNYFTVWKKQSDGSWKVALDGGNNSPKPKI